MGRGHESGAGDQHAIVIGGSMAGLLAARVLADHFQQVTIVDHDTFPDGPEFRHGVPQAYHIHVLLARGLDILSQLFPGIADELIAAEAIPLEWPRDVLWQSPRGWVRRFTPGITFVASGRELLEWIVRRRVAAFPNVRFLEGHSVTELLTDTHRRAVQGVRVVMRSTNDRAQIDGSFVVDASGRRSRAGEWLEALGYEPPRESVVNPFLGYASRDYAIPGGFDGDWKAVMLQAKPPHAARSGYVFQITPERWRVALTGSAREYPPTDDEGFLAFARSLRSPIVHDAIVNAEPLGPVRGYRETQNRRRYYERLRRMPERFLVMGDAMCTFNPIYGQGMTAAAQAAEVLGRLLQRRGTELDGLGRQFHRAAAKANASAWLMATSEDLRYPTTEGGARNLQTRLTHLYLDRVFRAALENRETHFAFADVVQLVDQPGALFKPKVLVPALMIGGRPDRPTPDKIGKAAVELTLAH